MDKEEVAEAVRRAIELTESVEGEFRVPAFQVVLTRLLEVDEWVGASVMTENVEGSPTSRGSNLLELINRVKPRTHRERVLLMAYSMRIEGNDVFNVRDMENLYSKLLMPKPKNINDVVNQNRKQGYVVKLDEDKEGMTAFSITGLGVEEIERLQERRLQ